MGKAEFALGRLLSGFRDESIKAVSTAHLDTGVIHTESKDLKSEWAEF